MPGLPLKVKAALRDHWSAPDCSLQANLTTLQAVLGREVAVDPEWAQLLADLDAIYTEDKGALVTAVASTVVAWTTSLQALLEHEEANEQWIETLLENIQPIGRLRLFVEVVPTKASGNGYAETTWDSERTGFIVRMPRRAVTNGTEFVATFTSELLDAFNDKKFATGSLPVREAPATSADDWADVEMDTKTGKVNVVDKPQTVTAVARAEAVSEQRPRYDVEFFPNFASLPRPDELLNRPPYHLIVSDHGRQTVEIKCSHSPTLQFLSDYLKKWCRVNHNDTRNPPSIKAQLEQSPWGMGNLFDRLVLTTEENRYIKQFSVNPCIVLALVEGVLGYQQVSVEAGQWTYRRDDVFRH